MRHSEIRKTFLAFYSDRGHTIVPSASLLPRDDPTLLFTSAGMVQFKPHFAGSIPLPYRRAASIQKCLRGSDLPQVGRSVKHLTFFEMLGNFSFGDYFKKEGIEFAWDYLTKVAKLDKDLLSVSVFEEDQEAYDIWHRHIGLPEGRIYRLGPEDNFWGPAGGVGACGPCSEIYFDLGPEFGCGRTSCAPGCGCMRFTEIYNVVFPQYDQQPDGARLPLKNRGIDTGMGLERLAMVTQGVRSLFQTDLFAPLVAALCRITGLSLEGEAVPFCYAAVDHARALTFAIADGAIPSNEARGYVLRNILRRALLKAHQQNVREPFLYRLSGEVVELMRHWYPELAAKREQTASINKSEEERFLGTLEKGLERWQQIVERCRCSGTIPGDEAFRLHDTYGFPVELTLELAREEGLEVDVLGFEEAMAKQRERSKETTFIQQGAGIGAWSGSGTEASGCCFCGYDRDEVETSIRRLVFNPKGDLDVLLGETPFYAEAGGQVGDRGRILGDGFELEVLDTRYVGGLRWSKAKVISGAPYEGAQVRAILDRLRRREIERAHTATHLLHAALRCTLGDYVKQEGSYVEPGRLRFDFSAYEPLNSDQLARVERVVYERILEDLAVEALRDLPIEEARKLGALAFFADDYGDRVNVIRIGTFSVEFCGGTHLRRTGELGIMKVTSETGVAAGIRRIEALVGERAYTELSERDQVLGQVGAMLTAEPRLLSQ
ncbi:MAG: alanine--tRNA ligase, partial [candidate division WOR-3 bacterium]